MTGQLNRPVGSIQAEDVPLSESLIPYNQLLLLRNLSHGGGGTVDLYLWIGRTVAVKKLVLQVRVVMNSFLFSLHIRIVFILILFSLNLFSLYSSAHR